MAGEIAVMLNIPQPFTVRTRRLSQVIRISHHHFKQIVQPNNDDGKNLFTNFAEVRKIVHLKYKSLSSLVRTSFSMLTPALHYQHLKKLKKEEQDEIPYFSELLEDLDTEVLSFIYSIGVDYNLYILSL